MNSENILICVLIADDAGFWEVEKFHAGLTGDEKTKVEQAEKLVAAKGYTIIANGEGGCCELVRYSDGGEDWIGITVEPLEKEDEG